MSLITTHQPLTPATFTRVSMKNNFLLAYYTRQFEDLCSQFTDMIGTIEEMGGDHEDRDWQRIQVLDRLEEWMRYPGLQGTQLHRRMSEVYQGLLTQLGT